MRTSSTNKRNAISTSGVTMNTKKKLRNPSTRVNFIDNEEEDNHSNNNITKYPNAKNEDAYISSEEDIDSVEDDDDEEEEEEETVDAKRVRLAREYLTKMEQMEHGTNSSSSTSSSSSSIDSDDDDHDKDDSKREEDREDNLTKRLRKERLKREGLHESYRAHLVQSSISSHWKYLQQQQQSSSSVSHISRITTTTQKEYEARQWIESGRVQCRRGHDLTPTCVALHDSGSFAYSGSKDGSIIMWDVERGGIRIQNVVSKWNAATTTTTTTTNQIESSLTSSSSSSSTTQTRNGAEVLSISCSDDGRYLASGSRDGIVRIYDVRSASRPQSQPNNLQLPQQPQQPPHHLNKPPHSKIIPKIHQFEGHKGPIHALTFRKRSLQLFSGSSDRCIRHHDLSDNANMAYIETLYGHQHGVTDISCSSIIAEMPVSVGRDRTVRAWKLNEDSHLIFRGGASVPSADCVSVPRDDWFLTGHENGLLCLWNNRRKKATASVEYCHGFDGTDNDDDNHVDVVDNVDVDNTRGLLPRGIVCCNSLPGSDLAVTGSHDGYARFWKMTMGETNSDRKLEAMGKIPLHGFVNDAIIGPGAKFCIAALGQEPRLGRWKRIPRAKNRFVIMTLRGDKDNGAVEELVEDENDDEDDVDDDDDDSTSDESLAEKKDQDEIDEPESDHEEGESSSSNDDDEE